MNTVVSLCRFCKDLLPETQTTTFSIGFAVNGDNNENIKQDFGRQYVLVVVFIDLPSMFKSKANVSHIPHAT